MIRYTLGVEDLTIQDRAYAAPPDYCVTTDYDGPSEASDEARLIKPHAMTWLNGEPLQIGLRNHHIEGSPVVSNRPTEDNSDSLTTESLCYDHRESRPLATQRKAVYHPFNRSGILEVMMDGKQKQIRVTLVARLVVGEDVLLENSTAAEPGTVGIDQIQDEAA